MSNGLETFPARSDKPFASHRPSVNFFTSHPDENHVLLTLNTPFEIPISVGHRGYRAHDYRFLGISIAVMTNVFSDVLPTEIDSALRFSEFVVTELYQFVLLSVRRTSGSSYRIARTILRTSQFYNIIEVATVVFDTAHTAKS